MEKIIRSMDRLPNWSDLSKANNLKIKNVQTHIKTEPYYTYENIIVFDRYIELSFNICYGNTVLSLVNQKISNAFLATENEINLINVYEWLSNHETLHVNQNLFMSYLNRKESKVLNKEIGDKVLYLKKEFIDDKQLLLFEEELSKVDYYIFEEGDFN